MYTVHMEIYVYILASKKYGVLYVWVTNNLPRRIDEHRQWLVDWSTKKYFVKKLVYYEQYPTIVCAIQREKQIKWWSRQDKLHLIEKNNPAWKDLYGEVLN